MEKLYAIIYTCLPEEHFMCEPGYNSTVFQFLFIFLIETAILSCLDKFAF